MASNQTNSTKPETLNLSARKAHVALAAQVELQGQPLAKALYEAARIYNAEFFAGALLPCFVEVTTPGSLRSWADYRLQSVEGVESHIRIAPKAAERGLRFALDVLLHEMVHAYCAEMLGDLEPGYAGHGPKWTAQCNRIGRMLGLPEVFVKGRGGKNSAQWPLCVRPAGYYGEEAEPKPKTERKSREASKPEPAAADPLEEVREHLCSVIRNADLETLEIIAAFFLQGVERKAS